MEDRALTVSLPSHLWLVEQVTASRRDPQPGILLEWRRDAEGWWGLVLHSSAGGLHFRWVRATELHPG